MDVIADLSDFGLSRQEAAIYLCLLAEGELNGYELCKLTGISRSNVYTGVAGLVGQGAAWLIEGDSTRYRAVPIDEFCGNRIRRLQDVRDKLVASLPAQKAAVGGYLTIRGEQAIADRMHNLVQEARQRIYLSLDSSLLDRILASLETAGRRGLKIVAILNAADSPRLARVCPEAIIHDGQPGRNQIRLIIDSSHVLTGDMSGGTAASCLCSTQKNLVDLFKDALKNEILLIQMGQPNQNQEEPK
jgi:sugar-specific transcriptional regulator TrmB